MAFAFGLTETGLKVPRTADFLAEIDARYLNATGIDLDSANPDNSDQQLVILNGIFAQLLDEVSQALIALHDAFDPDAATGVQATNLARIVGVARKGATRSRVALTLTGSPNAAIAAGLIVQGGGADGTATWTTIEDATLDGSGSATGITAEASETGPIAAPAATITSIVTPRAGLTAVTNPAAAVAGVAAESLDQLRVRRRQSPAAAGAHTVDALRASVLAVPGVTDALLIDNPDNAIQTVNGVSLPAHSYAVYVLPNPLGAADQGAVLDALQANLHIGVRNGVAAAFSRTVSVGQSTYTLGVAYGTLLTANVVATLTVATGFALADLQAELQAAVDAYVTPLQMGGPLTRLTLCQLAAGINGVTAAAFTINGANADLFPNANEKLNAAIVTAVAAS
ncbi:MAG: baseplate J/gp47 family protein [Myxococcota bacterium]